MHVWKETRRPSICSRNEPTLVEATSLHVKRQKRAKESPKPHPECQKWPEKSRHSVKWSNGQKITINSQKPTQNPAKNHPKQVENHRSSWKITEIAGKATGNSQENAVKAKKASLNPTRACCHALGRFHLPQVLTVNVDSYSRL